MSGKNETGLGQYIPKDDERADRFVAEESAVLCFPCSACQLRHESAEQCAGCRHCAE